MATTLQQHKINLAITAENLQKNLIKACNIIANELNNKDRTDLLIYKNGLIRTLNFKEDETKENILTARVVITKTEKKEYRKNLHKNFSFQYTDPKVTEIFFKIIETLKKESENL